METTENINNQLGAQLEALSSQIEAGLERGHYTLAELNAMLRDKGRRAATVTNDYVQENPWKVMLVGGLVGLGLGLVTRCCMED